MLAASLVLTTSADPPQVRGLLSLSTPFSYKTQASLDRIKQSSRGRTLSPEDLAAIEGPDDGDGTGLEPAPVRDNAYVCPPDMVIVPLSGRSYCIDVHEASLVQILPGGRETPWPFYDVVPPGVAVRAVSLPGVDPDGTFQGGYYLDTHLNGDGCSYRTTAHPMSHFDYSTGFRCCADVDPL
jgi:hypothetical protein